MQIETTRGFEKRFDRLPEPVRRQARKQLRRLFHDPQHPSLRLKKVSPRYPLFSLRINRDYRMVGVLEEGILELDFIGPHDEYERYIQRVG